MILKEFKRPLSVLPLFASGFYFGILQAAIYFSIEVFVTATFAGYFLLILTWLCGVVFAMKTKYLKEFSYNGIVSLITFYLFLLMVMYVPFQSEMYVLIALPIFVSAFPAGKFFKVFAETISPDTLFFHENNGFVAGTIFGLLLFVKFGVMFIYLAPFAAMLVMVLSFYEKEKVIVLILSLIAIFFFVKSYWIGIVCTLVLIPLIIWFSTILPKPVIPANDALQPDAKVLPFTKLKSVLFIAGFNLIILQYFIVREFSTIISANELSILVVNAAYLTGFSFGYAFSMRMKFSSLKMISLITFIIHIAIFCGIKFFASYLLSNGFSIETLLLLLFISSFLTSSFYSIFLPKIIHENGGNKLSDFYTVELLGAGSGVLFFLLALKYISFFLLPAYFFLFVILILLLFEKSVWKHSIFAMGIFFTTVFTIHQDKLFLNGNEDYYQSLGFHNPKLLFSGNSFYHTVDVLETYRDKAQSIKTSKVSFINGQKYFDYSYPIFNTPVDESSLSEFTYFLASVPTQHKFHKSKTKQRILILGGGSLYSINRVAPYSSKTTIVEIDPVVVESSKKLWKEFNRYDQYKNYEIVIDDAKRYLRTSDEKFDIIVMDISAPYYLGSALLHNSDFFRLVKSKLKPDGIFSESTQGRPDPYYPEGTAMKIFKAVDEVFPNYLFIDCFGAPRGKRGFVMASNDNAATPADVTPILKKDNKLTGTSLFTKKENHFTFQGVRALSLYSMENLWDGNLNRIKKRLNQSEIQNHHVEYHFINYLKKQFLNYSFAVICLLFSLASISLRFFLPKKDHTILPVDKVD